LMVAVGALSVVSMHRASAAGPMSSWNVVSTPNPTGSWFVVKYLGGKWIALGHTSNVATSSDGVTWTEHSIPAGSWQSVTFGNGRYVALNAVDATPHEIVSTNGTNWSTVGGPDGPWTSVTYGGGLFVAVGSLGQIYTSSDGLSWTKTFLRPHDDFTSVAYGNGRFLAVDAAHGDTAVALDGVHWAFYLTPKAGEHWGAVAYGDGNFVAFDRSGSGFNASTVLGALWLVHSYAPVQEIDGAVYGCGSFVATGQSSGSGNNFFLSSTGAVLSPVGVPGDAGSDWTSVAYANHRFVAVDDAGNIASATTNANCSATTPMAPKDVSGFPHNNSVVTFIHPPPSAGGAPIDGYRMTISNGVVTRTCHAAVYYEPNCNTTGLSNRMIYQVTTQAHNRFGYSVPSDPEMVIPVPSAKFNVTTAAPVVLDTSPVVLQATGEVYNNLGIYPHSLVTVHYNARVLTCKPNPFGECLLTVNDPSAGGVTISASYTGYGVFYSSPVNHITVASVGVSSTNVATNQSVSVTFSSAVAHSTARVTLNGSTFQGQLDGAGNGTLHLSAPANAGSYQLSISDAGVTLEKVTLSVHT
jgi:hypothetical protein